MAVVKFINGENKNKAGVVRVIDYIIDENKTEVFNIEDEDAESLFIDQLIEENKGDRAINYVTKEGKTHSYVTTGIGCNPESAFDEMMVTKNMHKNTGGRQFIHFVHSYHDKEKISPEKAHEISLKLIDQARFKGFEMVVATHVDKDHLHTHFVLNTVNAMTGKKWQQSNWELEELRAYSNKLCHEYGLKYSFTDLSKNRTKDKANQSSGEFRAENAGRSYKHEIFLAVKACRKLSTSKDEFIKNMNDLGYGVKWDDSRKNITFMTPSGRKINNDKLYPAKNFTKEALIETFEKNRQWQQNKDNFKEKQQFESTKQLVIHTVRSLANSPDPGLQKMKDYPLTYMEGQALKEKMLQQAKGSGLDWEHER